MAGFSAFGTQLEINTGIGVLIAELTNIGGPTVSLETIDVSSNDSWRRQANIANCTFTNGTNLVNAVAHGLVDNEPVAFRPDGIAGVLPAELTDDHWYYVVNRTNDTFQVALTPGGAVVTFTDDGTAHIGFYRAAAYREYAGNIIDGGEISLEGNLALLADAAEIKDALDDRDECIFTITFPTGDTWIFDGIVTAFESSAPYDDKLAFTAGVKVTGQPVLS